MSNANLKPQGDNLLGICHHLGEAMGINPLFLRVAFAAGLLFDARLSLLAYACCGVIVLADKALSRFARRWGAKPRVRQLA